MPLDNPLGNSNMTSDIKLGMALAAVAHGTSLSDFVSSEAFNKEAGASPTFNAEVAHTIGTMYELAGKENSLERHLLHVCQKQAALGNDVAEAILEEFSEALYDTLGSDEDLSKEAAVAGTGAVASLLAKLGLSTPGAIKTLLLGSAALGTGAGALHWKMNRDSVQDEADIEAMQAKVDTYNRITNEISSRMKEKGIVPGQEEDLEELSGAQRVDFSG
jgi:hypothetical protein